MIGAGRYCNILTIDCYWLFSFCYVFHNLIDNFAVIIDTRYVWGKLCHWCSSYYTDMLELNYALYVSTYSKLSIMWNFFGSLKTISKMVGNVMGIIGFAKETCGHPELFWVNEK